MQIGNLPNRTIFFLGWLLSPFTFWNDAFINVPFSYLMASLTLRFVHADFSILLLIFYWISNGLGLLLMYLSGKKLIGEGNGVVKELVKLSATLIAYSIVLILLSKVGVVKPF